MFTKVISNPVDSSSIARIFGLLVEIALLTN